MKSSVGRVAFFINGLTTAVLKPLGTQPSVSEQFTSFVIDGNSMSLYSLMRKVGQGCNRQDFVGEFLMLLLTVS